MSISSLMTATLPHNSHYSHHRYDQDPSIGHYSYSLSNGSTTRLATSHSFPHSQPPTPNSSSFPASRQLPPLSNMSTLHSTSQTNPRNKKAQPDWETFYRNGPPKEIIVIDDDDESPQSQMNKTTIKRQPSPQARPGAQPQTKKRRTAYDSVRDYHASYPAQTYSPLKNSSSNDLSDQRGSHQTTAPTSLGSHTSHGSAGAYIEDVNVGQKRKRVTRNQVAADRKRQEANVVDAYVPPPHPPYKSKEVHVPTMRDVR